MGRIRRKLVFPRHGEEKFFEKVKKTWAGNHIIHGVPDMESMLDDEIDLGKLNGVIAEFKGQPDSLIEVLHHVQERSVTRLRRFRYRLSGD